MNPSTPKPVRPFRADSKDESTGSTLEKMRSEREWARAYASALDRMIRQVEEFDGGRIPSDVRTGATKYGGKQDLIEYIKEILRDAGRPMSRAELAERLEEGGAFRERKRGSLKASLTYWSKPKPGKRNGPPVLKIVGEKISLV